MKPKCQYVDHLPSDALEIPGFPNQFATPRGEIFAKFGRLKLRRFSSNSCGYPTCGLRHESGAKKFPLVHRLIAQMFVAGDQSLTANHIDMDKTNCAAVNLEWITLSANHLKAHDIRPNRKARPCKRLLAFDPETKERHEFDSGKAAAQWVGNPTAAGNISKACISGRTAYGFSWSFL